MVVVIVVAAATLSGCDLIDNRCRIEHAVVLTHRAAISGQISVVALTALYELCKYCESAELAQAISFETVASANIHTQCSAMRACLDALCFDCNR
jgi:hypothetical protein